jgi:hypothetical protein
LFPLDFHCSKTPLNINGHLQLTITLLDLADDSDSTCNFLLQYQCVTHQKRLTLIQDNLAILLQNRKARPSPIPKVPAELTGEKLSPGSFGCVRHGAS